MVLKLVRLDPVDAVVLVGFFTVLSARILVARLWLASTVAVGIVVMSVTGFGIV